MTPDPGQRRAGIDVGGTKLLAVVLDRDGIVVREERRPTPRGVDALMETLVALAGDLGEWDTLGVGIPGFVTRSGVVRTAPNLYVHDLPVAELLTAALGRPVAVDNDATCAVVAEWLVGVARGEDDVVMVTLGTGIGGGIVAGGRLQRGTNGFAGEIGHMAVRPDGPACACGRRGCWERYASGGGLARLAHDAARAGRLGRARHLAGGDPEAVRGEHVQAAAREGDPEAAAVIEAFAGWVALGLVNLANVFDPALLVIGGGLADAPDVYLGPIAARVAEMSSGPRSAPRLVFATLGARAGAVGAALLPAAHV